jgi:hypothetical protein
MREAVRFFIKYYEFRKDSIFIILVYFSEKRQYFKVYAFNLRKSSDNILKVFQVWHIFIDIRM